MEPFPCLPARPATPLHGGASWVGCPALSVVAGALLSLGFKGAVSGTHSMCLPSLPYDAVEEGRLTAASRYQESVLKKKNKPQFKCGICQMSIAFPPPCHPNFRFCQGLRSSHSYGSFSDGKGPPSLCLLSSCLELGTLSLPCCQPIFLLGFYVFSSSWKKRYSS